MRAAFAQDGTAAEPVEPAKPPEPAKPVEPAKPPEAAKPVEAAKPIEPAKGAEPAKSPELTLEAIGVSPLEGEARTPIDLNEDADTRTASMYLWPLLETEAINIFLWSIPYAAGVPFAQVTPSMWKDNFRTGFQWDDNEFEVNQFAHPYQGGMYFTTARIHGLNFWEAVPYTAFGSFMWEFFMETEQPATNDFLTTTWGGTLLGESLYRLSNNMVDESQSGGGRFWSEFAAFAINPVNGLDRLASGRAWVDGPTTKRFPLLADLRVGTDGIGLSEGTGWGKTVRGYIRFDYGDLYAKPSFDTPFEAFNLAFELSVGEDIIGEGIDANGVLLGHRFSMGEGNVNLLAWTMNFEYFTNGSTKMLTRDPTGVYQLSAMGTGPTWYGHWGLGNGFSFDGRLNVNAVPTGAITSPYAKYEANRKYNYGVGGEFQAEVNLRHERFGRLYAQANRYLYYVVDGARGTEHVGAFKVGAYANIYRGHGLGATAIYYDRNSTYDNYPDVQDSFWSGQVHYELEY